MAGPAPACRQRPPRGACAGRAPGTARRTALCRPPQPPPGDPPGRPGRSWRRPSPAAPHCLGGRRDRPAAATRGGHARPAEPVAGRRECHPCGIRRPAGHSRPGRAGGTGGPHRPRRRGNPPPRHRLGKRPRPCDGTGGDRLSRTAPCARAQLREVISWRQERAPSRTAHYYGIAPALHCPSRPVAEVEGLMAEPRAITPPRGAAPEWDVLVATKFHVPRAGFVPRPRLLARLAQGVDRGLTVVCTPAGFGKTTLLGDWARRSRRPAAWLSLDAGDNDPARFWRYLAAALERARPGTCAPLAALLRGPQQPPLEAVVTALINELMAGEREVTLLLDDYHLIEAPPVHDSVTFLLDRLPPGLRLVLASRADPPLPLARLRARGQLAELRAADLRFTLEETAAFLREATGRDLPTLLVATLQDLTEGWAAGVQLAALSLQGHSDPAGFVATFAGSNRYVLDYLTEEVLARQPEDVVRFLMETSVLDRLCGPLCDAVTGRTGSQARLEALERANLFLVPLDDERRWWRYHHLFAGLLRTRLASEQPGRVPELHRRAAAWHEEHGSADEAVQQALAAGEADWAARLVERHVEGLLRRSEGATVRRWLSALPAASVRARARLCLAQTITAVVGGQLEAVEPLLADAERAFAATGDEPHQPSTRRAMSVLANVPASIAF